MPRRGEPSASPRRPAPMKKIRRVKDSIAGGRIAIDRIARGHSLAVLFLAVALLTAGCSVGTVAPSPAPTASGPLVTVETRGGECFAAPCGMTVILERDGRVHQSAKPPNELGTVPPGALAAFDAAIRTTDFTALKSHTFTGQCPTAYDGQEVVFEFGAPGGVQRIATCEVQVDFGQPLFLAVRTALGPFVPLGST